MARRKAPYIADELLDRLLSGTDAATALQQGGLLDELKRALADRALNAEMDHHLGGEAGVGNSRNGYGRKTVLTDTGGRIALEVPRDRQGSFDPQLIAKYQRRFPGFDEKIMSLYARGLSTREIAGHVLELYGVEVSPDLVSAVTDAVLDEIATWQARPLEPVYPLVFFDALRVKIRDEGLVRNKAVHIALGVRADGTKEILGLWLEQNEGAKFWLRVLNELRNRGVEDILLALVDGLKGFPEAIQAAFPETTVQTCIVHLLRHSLDFVSWKDRRAVAAALKEIYRAVDPTAAEAALTAFEDGPWGRKYAAIGPSWRRAWTEVVPFYAFPAEVRRMLYTTNAIEALNAKLRSAVRTRGTSRPTKRR
jgi:putative transposase